MAKQYGGYLSVLKEGTRYMRNNLDNPTNDPLEDYGAKYSLTSTDNVMKDYLKKADQYRPLSDDELKMLFEKIDNGAALKDQVTDADKLSGKRLKTILDMVAARQVVLTANLKLVSRLAKSYYYKGNTVAMPFADIFMAGTEGLAEGIDRFDVSRGNKLSTYVSQWIRDRITQAIPTEAYSIVLPRKELDKYNRHQRRISNLNTKLGRIATIQEQLDHLEIDREEFESFRLRHNPTLPSVNQPVGDGDTELGELLANNHSEDSDKVEEDSIKQYLKDLIDNPDMNMNDREKFVLCLRFGIDPELVEGLETTVQQNDATVKISYVDAHAKRLEENTSGIMSVAKVGELLGVSHQRVSQILSSAGKKFREAAHNQAA